MAFGINRYELKLWKKKVNRGEIAFLTHYWVDQRFPHCQTVTKVGCNDLNLLLKWGENYDLLADWIDHHQFFPHFDLFGNKQLDILLWEGKWDHIERFKLIRSVY